MTSLLEIILAIQSVNLHKGPLEKKAKQYLSQEHFRANRRVKLEIVKTLQILEQQDWPLLTEDQCQSDKSSAKPKNNTTKRRPKPKRCGKPSLRRQRYKKSYAKRRASKKKDQVNLSECPDLKINPKKEDPEKHDSNEPSPLKENAGDLESIANGECEKQIGCFSFLKRFFRCRSQTKKKK